jgi:hypothetical protein
MNGCMRFGTVVLFLASMAGGSGCMTRAIALKEHKPGVAARPASALKGKSVYIAKFAYAPAEAAATSMPAAQEPEGYTYIKMASEDEKAWDRDVRELKKTFTKSPEARIGSVRNGYGMVMGGVYRLNDPGEWMRECLALDVAAQGAKVVASESEADLSVSGTIDWLFVDCYMKYWADLLTRVSLKARGKAPVERTLHTSGGQMSWSSSSFEFYQPLRQCMQKFSLLTLSEMEKAAQP